MPVLTIPLSAAENCPRVVCIDPTKKQDMYSDTELDLLAKAAVAFPKAMMAERKGLAGLDSEFVPSLFANSCMSQSIIKIAALHDKETPVSTDAPLVDATDGEVGSVVTTTADTPVFSRHGAALVDVENQEAGRRLPREYFH